MCLFHQIMIHPSPYILWLHQINNMSIKICTLILLSSLINHSVRKHMSAYIEEHVGQP